MKKVILLLNFALVSSMAGAQLKVITGGNVGINQSSPGTKFHVSGNENANYVATIENTNVNGHKLYMAYTNTASPTYKYGLVIQGGDDGTYSYDLIVGTSNKFLVRGDGRVGVGQVNPGGQFELSLDEGRKPSTNLWTITSDDRLKNIEGSYTKGLKEILQLQPIKYHYKNVGDRKFSDAVLSTANVGFSAQDVQKIFPEAVGTDDDGYLNFNMHSILVASLNAFKEQQQMIDSMNTKLADLQAALQTCCTTQGQRKMNPNEQGKTETTLQVELANNTQTILYQNEPNPTDGSTVIRYFIPENVTANAYVIFYDMYGKEVNKLEIKDKGFGKIEANTENLASGIYSYSIIVSDKTIDTKKMLKSK